VKRPQRGAFFEFITSKTPSRRWKRVLDTEFPMVAGFRAGIAPEASDASCRCRETYSSFSRVEYFTLSIVWYQISTYKSRFKFFFFLAFLFSAVAFVAGFGGQAHQTLRLQCLSLLTSTMSEKLLH
jgi:hypothetical protein